MKEMSSNLLRMRFMNRQEETDRREKLRREEEDRLIQARWVVKSSDAEDKVILILTEDRFDLSPPIGRRSFRGFNNALETLVVQQMREHKQSESRKVKQNKTKTNKKKKKERGLEFLDPYGFFLKRLNVKQNSMQKSCNKSMMLIML